MPGIHHGEAKANEVQNNIEEAQIASVSSLDILAQVKEENKMLKNALQNSNRRLGDEIISDSDSSLDGEGEVHVNPVNTRHFEIDSLFAPNYYFITNVSLNYFQL